MFFLRIADSLPVFAPKRRRAVEDPIAEEEEDDEDAGPTPPKKGRGTSPAATQ